MEIDPKDLAEQTGRPFPYRKIMKPSSMLPLRSFGFIRLKARRIALGLSIVLVLALVLLRPKREPSFQGTSFTDWTYLVTIANPEDPGVKALLAIGPPAVSYILKGYDGFGTPLQRSKLYSDMQQYLPNVVRRFVPRPTLPREESSKAGLLFVLGQIRPSPAEVEPFLARQLQSELPSVRFYACESLRLQGRCSPQTASNIARLLKDPDTSTRFCTVRTLLALKKLDHSMTGTLEQLARENDSEWSTQIAALAHYSLWTLGTRNGESNLHNFLRTAPLQALQWAIDPLKADPHAARTFVPDLLERVRASTDDRETEFLNLALVNLCSQDSDEGIVK